MVAFENMKIWKKSGQNTQTKAKQQKNRDNKGTNIQLCVRHAGHSSKCRHQNGAAHASHMIHIQVTMCILLLDVKQSFWLLGVSQFLLAGLYHDCSSNGKELPKLHVLVAVLFEFQRTAYLNIIPKQTL